MNWYKTAKKVQPKDSNFSWVRLDLPEKIIEVHALFVKEIDNNDLYLEWQNKKDWEKGVKDDPHITVKYGIEFDEPDKVIEVLGNEKGDKVQIEKIEIFDDKEDYDVLVIACKSDALQKIHEKLTIDLETPDSYPDYVPHITLAYFLKGKAKKYKKMAEEVFIDLPAFKFNEVIFEDTKDKQTKIQLD